MPQQQPAPESQKNLNQFNKFLENNVDFLEEKYAEHFKQAFPFNELQTKARIELAIEFIYDVFSFQKYKNDQKMNATLRKSLRDNIVNFVKEQEAKSKKTGAEDKKVFTSQQGIKLLKYCIQNNEMFAVHYDKKEKKAEIQKQSEITNQNNSQHQEKSLKDEDEVQESPIEKQTQVKNNSRLSEKSSSPVKEIQKSESPHVNEFPTTSQQQKQHIETLKKQAKIIFEFYCKQQLNAGGPNATFDKISHESNTMTLGKFMAFANTTTILYQTKVQAYKPKDQKMLDKKTINQIFRKISKGQKEIDFAQFFELIVKLNQIDPSVYEKLNMNKSQTHNKILRKLKYLNTPFNMKMHLAKQPQTFIIEEKPYIPINTAHSGKFQSSIKEDIEERKQKLRLLPHQPYPNPNQVKLSYETFMGNESSLRQKFLQQQILQSRIRAGNNKFLSERILAPGSSKTATDHSSKKPQISKIRLQNSRISFENDMKEEINALQGLIMPDDDNDELFLKQYKIPKLSSNIGLRKKSNNSQLNHSIDEGIVSQSRKFSGFKTQRKNVVNDIKQRILQVEKTQRKQMTGRNTQRSHKYDSHSSASRNARY